MTRDEAISVLNMVEAYGVADTAKQRAIEALKNERPKGRWITKWSGDGWNDDFDYTCSVCGKEYRKAGSVLYHSSYCPHCGADMRQNLVGKHADVTIIDEGANNETGNEVP